MILKYLFLVVLLLLFFNLVYAESEVILVGNSTSSSNYNFDIPAIFVGSVDGGSVYDDSWINATFYNRSYIDELNISGVEYDDSWINATFYSIVDIDSLFAGLNNLSLSDIVDNIGNFSAWDKDYNDLINTPTTNNDNSSWNESYANTLYYSITNPLGFLNISSLTNVAFVNQSNTFLEDQFIQADLNVSGGITTTNVSSENINSSNIDSSNINTTNMTVVVTYFGNAGGYQVVDEFGNINIY